MIINETPSARCSVFVPGMFLHRVGWTHVRFVTRFSIHCALFSLGFLFSAAFAIAQPSIAAIENNYSYIPPGSPNYGIAQGSLFIIFGKNLANVSSSSRSFPLTASLGGTSLTVRVDGTTTHPIPYYVTPGQIAAILPSATPAGVGVLTVTNNGVTSQPLRIQVVQTDFGIDTLYGGGYGPAVAQHANGQILGPTNSANPGETIVLWGSGVGPDPNNDEVSYPQKQNNLSDLPMEVDIGGIAAAISYRGRSPYPGVDQINVTVPPNVPAGCWVSVVVWTETHIGNFATIPVAANGATCSDQSTGYTGTQLATLFSKPSISIGTIAVGNSPSLSYSPVNVTESFNVYTPAEFVASFFFPSIVDDLVLLDGPIALQYWVGLAAISIGSCVTLQEPQVSTLPVELAAGPIGFMQQTGTSPPAFQVQVNNGAGGAQVGPFSSELEVPFGFSSPGGPANWLDGLTLTWSNAAPDSFVQVYGASSGNGLYTAFICSAPASAGRLLVPSVVLGAMAPYVQFSEDGYTNPYFLNVTNYTYPEMFLAQGIDFGTIYGFEIGF